MSMRPRNFRLQAACQMALALTCATTSVLAAPPGQPLPNDPLFYRQWGMENINDVDIDLLTAWKMIESAPKHPVTVAVIDTSLDPQHADLRNRMHPATWDYVHNEPSVFDGIMYHSHLISTIIGAEANNAKSGTGVAGNVPVQIMAMQVVDIDDLDLANTYRSGLRPWDEVRVNAMADRLRDAFQDAIDAGARVINASTKAGLSREYYEIKAGTLTVQGLVDRLWNVDDGDDTPAEIAQKRAAHPYVAMTAYDLAESGQITCGELCSNATEIVQNFPAESLAALSANMAELVSLSALMEQRIDTEMMALIEHAKDNDVLIVASATNVPPSLPAAHRQDIVSFPEPSPIADNVLKVTSMKADGNRLETGEFGWSIDLFAPGKDITNGLPQNDLLLSVSIPGVALFDGASFAAPHVAGVAALALSVRPDLTYEQLRDALLAGAVELPGLQTQDSASNAPIAGRMIKAPLVLEQLGFALPGGRDGQGREQAPTARIKLQNEPDHSNNYQLYGLSLLPGESVGFTAADSSDAQGGITSYEWSFGDGTTVTTATPTVSHNFPNAIGGRYDVRVTVTDEQGTQDTSAPLRVNVSPANVDWAYVNMGGEQPIVIEGALECGNLVVDGNIWGRRITTGTGRIRATNGQLLEITINSTYSLLGYSSGTATIDDLAGNVQTRSWSLRPTSWSSPPKRMSMSSTAVSWSALDNVAGTACQ